MLLLLVLINGMEQLWEDNGISALQQTATSSFHMLPDTLFSITLTFDAI